jgi:hypothetical protein
MLAVAHASELRAQHSQSLHHFDAVMSLLLLNAHFSFYDFSISRIPIYATILMNASPA